MFERDLERPSVTISYAQTLDGRIATRTGNSQWISGEESLRLAHQLRANHQVVMVGVGTVLVDNPRLTLRLAPGPSPMRVIVDSTLRLPLDSNVLSKGAAKTLVVTTTRATERRMASISEAGARVMVVDQDAAGRVDLVDMFQHLALLGVGSVLVEGGRRIITSILQRRLADRLVVCIAPKIIGSGIEAVGELNIRRLSEAITFTGTTFIPLGEDIVFDGQIAPDRVRERAGERVASR